MPRIARGGKMRPTVPGKAQVRGGSVELGDGALSSNTGRDDGTYVGPFKSTNPLIH